VHLSSSGLCLDGSTMLWVLWCNGEDEFTQMRRPSWAYTRSLREWDEFVAAVQEPTQPLPPNLRSSNGSRSNPSLERKPTFAILTETLDHIAQYREKTRKKRDEQMERRLPHHHCRQLHTFGSPIEDPCAFPNVFILHNLSSAATPLEEATEEVVCEFHAQPSSVLLGDGTHADCWKSHYHGLQVTHFFFGIDTSEAGRRHNELSAEAFRVALHSSRSPSTHSIPNITDNLNSRTNTELKPALNDAESHISRPAIDEEDEHETSSFLLDESLSSSGLSSLGGLTSDITGWYAYTLAKELLEEAIGRRSRAHCQAPTAELSSIPSIFTPVKTELGNVEQSSMASDMVAKDLTDMFVKRYIPEEAEDAQTILDSLGDPIEEAL